MFTLEVATLLYLLGSAIAVNALPDNAFEEVKNLTKIQ